MLQVLFRILTPVNQHACWLTRTTQLSSCVTWRSMRWVVRIIREQIQIGSSVRTREHTRQRQQQVRRSHAVDLTQAQRLCGYLGVQKSFVLLGRYSISCTSHMKWNARL